VVPKTVCFTHGDNKMRAPSLHALDLTTKVGGKNGSYSSDIEAYWWVLPDLVSSSRGMLISSFILVVFTVALVGV